MESSLHLTAYIMTSDSLLVNNNPNKYLNEKKKNKWSEIPSALFYSISYLVVISIQWASEQRTFPHADSRGYRSAGCR